MKLEWRNGIPLKSVDLIDEYEAKVNFKFPESFRNLVISNNGACPTKMVFDTEKEEGRVFHYLVSFNREDENNMFDYYDWASEDDFEELGKTYVEFASSVFGDPIAFDPETGYVIFVDHETSQVELIAKTFDEFLDKLRPLDGEEDTDNDMPEQTSAPSAERKSIFSFFKKKDQ